MTHDPIVADAISVVPRNAAGPTDTPSTRPSFGRRPPSRATVHQFCRALGARAAAKGTRTRRAVVQFRCSATYRPASAWFSHRDGRREGDCHVLILQIVPVPTYSGAHPGRCATPADTFRSALARDATPQQPAFQTGDAFTAPLARLPFSREIYAGSCPSKRVRPLARTDPAADTPLDASTTARAVFKRSATTSRAVDFALESLSGWLSRATSLGGGGGVCCVGAVAA